MRHTGPMSSLVAVMALVTFGSSAFSAVTLKRFHVGDRYQVVSTNVYAGWNEVTDEKGNVRQSKFSGKAKVAYREILLSPGDASADPRLFRLYDMVDYSRTIDGKEERSGLRKEARRILLDPVPNGFVVYSSDVKLQLPEVTLVDEHAQLASMEAFVADGELTPGRTWNASSKAVVELVGVDEIESGIVTCRVEGEKEIQQRRLLQISLTGEIIAKSGPVRTRSKITGGVYVDPATSRFIAIKSVGTQETLAEKDRVVGSLDVDYQVVVREGGSEEGLTPGVVAKLPAKASDEMLDLIFESPVHGLKFEHSRRWVLQRADAGRLYFAAPDATIVITLEPKGKIPTPEEYFNNVQAFLAKNKLDVKLTTRSDSLEGNVQQHFCYEGTFKDRATVLDYWLVVDGELGATIAANRNAEAPADVVEELPRLVKGIRLVAPTAK